MRLFLRATQPLLDDAEGSGWVGEVTSELLPMVGSSVLRDLSACPEPRFSLTPDTGHGPPAGEEESLHTICRKVNPLTWLLPTNLKHPGPEAKTCQAASTGQEAAGGEEDEPGPRVEGLAAQPPQPHTVVSSKGLKSQGRASRDRAWSL